MRSVLAHGNKHNYADIKDYLQRKSDVFTEFDAYSFNEARSVGDICDIIGECDMVFLETSIPNISKIPLSVKGIPSYDALPVEIARELSMRSPELPIVAFGIYIERNAPFLQPYVSGTTSVYDAEVSHGEHVLEMLLADTKVKK